MRLNVQCWRTQPLYASRLSIGESKINPTDWAGKFTQPDNESLEGWGGSLPKRCESNPFQRGKKVMRSDAVNFASRIGWGAAESWSWVYPLHMICFRIRGTRTGKVAPHTITPPRFTFTQANHHSPVCDHRKPTAAAEHPGTARPGSGVSQEASRGPVPDERALPPSSAEHIMTADTTNDPSRPHRPIDDS